MTQEEWEIDAAMTEREIKRPEEVEQRLWDTMDDQARAKVVDHLSKLRLMRLSHGFQMKGILDNIIEESEK